MPVIHLKAITEVGNDLYKEILLHPTDSARTNKREEISMSVRYIKHEKEVTKIIFLELNTKSSVRTDLYLDIQPEDSRQACKVGPGRSCTAAPNII